MKYKNLLINEIKVEGYEKILEIKNDELGLHAIIAIHSTVLGPACGGIRVYPYESFDLALNDALRLSKGMTLKAAVAQTGTGGAKSIIILDKTRKSKELLLSFAEAINFLNGEYIGGPDIGITADDCITMHEVTPYICGLKLPGYSGDPAPFTARGIFRGIQAVCQEVWGNPSVKGKKIAVQGLGSVGMFLIQQLFWEGAELIVTTRNPLVSENAVMRWGARSVLPENIYQVDCDIFSPCAIGGIINENVINQLNCRGIAGSANNQLFQTEKDSERLLEKNIIYAPDFVINSGGLINAVSEITEKKYQPTTARNKIDLLYDILLSIFAESKKSGKSTHQVAVERAEYNLKNAIKSK